MKEEDRALDVPLTPASPLERFKLLSDENKRIINRQIEILIASQSSRLSVRDYPA